MTAKTAAAFVSLGLAIGTLGCMSFYEIPIETPIQAKIDVGSFQRVLIAGFLAGGSNAIDPNAETARLLRSQLRSKSDLKVIDADVQSLVDVVDQQRDAAGPTDSTEPVPSSKSKAAEPKIKDEKDLSKYVSIFTDKDYWKKLGDEYDQPLIVTGSVLFLDISRSGPQSAVNEVTDPTGRRVTQEVRTYTDKKGFALVPRFVFIDGRTGDQLYSESFREEVLYDSSQNTPPLSSVLRADGQGAPELPQHAQHPEDQRHQGAVEVDPSTYRPIALSTYRPIGLPHRSIGIAPWSHGDRPVQ